MTTHDLSHPAKIIALTCLGALLLVSANLLRAVDPATTAAPPAPATSPEPRLFGGLVAEAVHATATVQSINQETREITLLGEKGAIRTIVAGPEVKRLAEIKAGDTIEAVYAEAVVVLAGEAAGVPARDDSVEIVQADKDSKPGAAALMTTRVLATIEALDVQARTATLKGPQRTVTIAVGADAVNFEKVKVGDRVYLEFTQAIAVAVTKSAPAK